MTREPLLPTNMGYITTQPKLHFKSVDYQWVIKKYPPNNKHNDISNNLNKYLQYISTQTENKYYAMNFTFTHVHARIALQRASCPATSAD